RFGLPCPSGLAGPVWMHPDPGPGLSFERISAVGLELVVVAAYATAVGQVDRAAFDKGDLAVVGLEVAGARAARHDTARVALQKRRVDLGRDVAAQVEHRMHVVSACDEELRDRVPEEVCRGRDRDRPYALEL